jgi:hypothetical protein
MNNKDNYPEGSTDSAFRFQEFTFDPNVRIAESVYLDTAQRVTRRGCLHFC